MAKKMLIDATHPEETRVAVVDGTRLEEFDFEIASRRQIKSNIYLAKVTRVEPSLQAAFVEYGGNRHGFLPFPEIHPDYYRIPVGDREYLDHEPQEIQEERPRRGRSRDRNVRNEAPPETDHADEDRSPEPVEAHGPAAEDVATDEHVADEAAPDGNTQLEAAARDPVMSEGDEPSHDEPAHDEDHHAEPAVTDGDEAAPATEGSVESAPAAEHTTVEIVGGDDVEDDQRRRRSQMPHYKIQEVIKRRQIMLVQVSKEERGNKGAAVTTFLSLPGRYCVLMPNTSRGGGVSRKIANPADRKRMKDLISDLQVPDGMSVILRTAGVERTKAEIKRDLEYLLRLWENIRELTLDSTAPALIYEEGNLVKRAIRDLYTRDIGEIEIAGEEGYRQAKDFMRMLMPSHAKRVQPYRDASIPLFHRYQVESQIDAIHNPVAHLRSGGYIVINQTEALVSIDVNSGRSTRERGIEETALKTNMEAADEIARQLRLRDMGGLIVIDFIDMDEPRHDAQVERRLKEAMKNDRARIQVGRISPFGLLELSRQRLHPSLIETNFHVCPHCIGTGLVRSIESASLLVLRAIEEEGIKNRSAELSVTVAGQIALYILNQKRAMLTDIEGRYGFSVRVFADDSLIAPAHRIDRVKAKLPGAEQPAPANLTGIMARDEEEQDDQIEDEEDTETASESAAGEADQSRPPQDGEAGGRRKRRRSRKRRGRGEGRPEDGHGSEDGQTQTASADDASTAEGEDEPRGEDSPAFAGEPGEPGDDNAAGAEGAGRRRRRGRRGGRNRARRSDEGQTDGQQAASGSDGKQTPDDLFIQDQLPVEPHADISPAELPRTEAAVAAVAAVESTPARGNGSADKPAAVPASEKSPAAPPTRAYETVNQPTDTPRRGWWKRLTE